MENTTNKPLRIAFMKGRLLPNILQLWGRLGFEVPEEFLTTRKLMITSSDGRFLYLLVKQQDIPFLLESNMIDIGIVGEDILLEAGENVKYLFDLGIGEGYLCLCGLPENKSKSIATIASCYPNLVKKVMKSRNQNVKVLQLGGSLELSVLLGLADAVLTLTETGKSIEESGLMLYEVVAKVSTYLVTSVVAYNQYRLEIQSLLAELRSAHVRL